MENAGQAAYFAIFGTGLDHLINGSLTEDVANHVDRPVLSIRIEEQGSVSEIGHYQGRFNNL